MSPTRFMLCSDDYALTAGVSHGILDLIAAGRLSATGVMSNRRAWAEGAQDLRAMAERVDVGLHLNLTQGEPLGDMPHLAPGGELPSLGEMLKRVSLGRIDYDEIRAEIGRQLDAFEQAMGRAPDFLDGHQHVQVLPGIRRALLDELTARGLAGKLSLRDSADALPRIFTRRIEAGKAATVAAFGRGFGASARRHGFAVNEGFAGFSAFDPRRDYGNDFRRFLMAPGERHLVMCHPGRVDAELAASDPVVETRRAELEFFLSNRFTDLLAQADSALSRWNS